MRNELREFAREARTWAPFILIIGAFVCMMGWAFAFSPAGVPIIVLGSAIIMAAVAFRPTPVMMIVGAVLVFLAWGGPWWVDDLI